MAQALIKEFQTSGHPVVQAFIPASTSPAGHLKCKRGEETLHVNAESSNPESLMRTILGDILADCYTVSSWHSRAHKRGKSEPYSELNISATDVATAVPHDTLDMPNASRDRLAPRSPRQPSFESLGGVPKEAGFPRKSL